MAEEQKVTKKQKQIKIPYAVFTIIAAVVILALVLVVALTGTKTVQCSTEKCFDHEFSLCQPTEWTTEEAQYPGVQFHYKIISKVGSSRCSVKFGNSETKTVSITCNFDNKESFDNAEIAANANTKEYDCRKT